MPRYMLDTDTCSYIMRRSPDSVVKRLAKVPVSDVCISVITKSNYCMGSKYLETPAGRSSARRLSTLRRSSGFPDRHLRTTPQFARISRHAAR